MLIVISPAKKLDFDTPPCTPKTTEPEFLAEADELIGVLRKLSVKQIGALMSISPNLAELNSRRYAEWAPPFTPANAKQAVLAFKGDVYRSLAADELGVRGIQYAQKHLRILSGLFGLLRPLDLIQPYRLEMGSRLKTGKGKDLYTFWGDTITAAINRTLKAQRSKTLINLASNEYFRSIQPNEINGELITPVFKERKGDQYRAIGLFAKRARGLMSRYIIDNRLRKTEDIKSFTLDDYGFNNHLSTDTEWVFTR